MATYFHTVTITGADDSTSIDWMLDLQQRFPFVEWGLLVSANNAGSNRFPTIEWLHDLYPEQHKLRTSVHVCGRWVRDICKGDWFPLLANVGATVSQAQRIQLNFHAEAHKLGDAFVVAAKLASVGKQLIFQLDGVNDHLVDLARCSDVRACPLYDRSGGNGVLPDEWPWIGQYYTGYAGGLGPDNIAEQLKQIAVKVGDNVCWIDMERRVRTEDDQQLDVVAVEKVLSICKQYRDEAADKDPSHHLQVNIVSGEVSC